jgi:hypothetical protein
VEDNSKGLGQGGANQEEEEEEEEEELFLSAV